MYEKVKKKNSQHIHNTEISSQKSVFHSFITVRKLMLCPFILVALCIKHIKIYQNAKTKNNVLKANNNLIIILISYEDLSTGGLCYQSTGTQSPFIFALKKALFRFTLTNLLSMLYINCFTIFFLCDFHRYENFPPIF